MFKSTTEIIVNALNAARAKADERLKQINKELSVDYTRQLFLAFDAFNSETDLGKKSAILKKIQRIERVVKKQMDEKTNEKLLDESRDLRMLISEIDLELRYRDKYHS